MPDLPAVRITAVDATGPAFKSAIDNVSSFAARLGPFAAQLLSVAAAVQAVRSAIGLGDELKGWSDTLGLPIEKLDRLSIVAKLNSTDLGDMAKAFKSVGAAMIEAQNLQTQSAQLFSALGVSVKDAKGNLRDVDDVMGETAKALSLIENETVRAQVGAALFGKSYTAIAATLRNYAEDQEKANQVLEHYGGVSETAANLSDELGDKFTLLGEGSKRALLGALAPGMAAVVAGLDVLIASGGKFQVSFGEFLSTGATIATQALLGLKSVVEIVVVSIDAAFTSIKTRSLDPLKNLGSKIAEIDAATFAATARVRAAAAGVADTEFGDMEGAIARAASAQGRLNASQLDAAKLARILAEATRGAKVQIADYDNEIDKLREEMEKLAGNGGGYEHMVAAEQKIQADLRAGKVVLADQADQYILTAIAADDLAKEIKDLAERWKSYEEAAKASLKFQEEIDDAIYKANLAIKQQNDALELEHATLGLTDNARQQFITRLKLEEAQFEGNTNAVILLTRQLDLLGQQARDNALLDMAKQAQEAFERATAFASDFFVDLFNNGSKAFKNLWENFKQLAFRAFADIAAKQVVLSITGAIGLGASGAASAGGGGGLGGIANGIGSLFGGGFGGGGGLLGAAGGFGAAQTAALDSALLTSFGGAFSGLAGGALTTALGPVIAALPWAGLAAIAIPLIGKLFDKGPANRTATFGSGDLGSDKSRDAVFSGSSAFGAFGITKDFWLGPEAGAAFRPTLDAITQLDNAIAGLVGGDLTKQITDALASHEITVGFGKEKTDINASGGPAAILKDRYVTVLTAIDAQLGKMVEGFQGTGEELANFVVNLVALHKTLGEAFKGLDTSSLLALGEAAGGLDKLAGSVAFLNANFITQADQTAKAQAQLAADFEKLGLAVPATHQAFLDLLGTFDLTTDAGRGLYASVLGLSGAFVQINGTATDAANAMKDASAAIEQIATASISASEAYYAVFGGKNPDAQAQSDAENKVRDMLSLFATVAGQSTGNYGEKLSLQIKLVTGALAKASPDMAALLRKTNTEFGASLRLFNDLGTRYDDGIAEQLVHLTETYNQQAQALKGNAQGLDALNQVFEEQWTAIINGTAAGVGGTMDQLKKLQQGILDYVDSLRISADSPLTASQKLAEAKRQYETTAGLAAGGDQNALGEVTRSADAYLKLARDFFASSSAYTDVFNAVTSQLTAIGTKDFGAGGSLNAADQALLDALPKSSTLASAADLQAVSQWISRVLPGTTNPLAEQSPGGKKAGVETLANAVVEGMSALVEALTQSDAANSAKVVDGLHKTKNAIVEAITVGRK